MSSIQAAIVSAWGEPPKYTTTTPLPPTDNTIQIRLIAAGQHQVVRSRAAGTHFSSKALPHIPGVDGVGTIISIPSAIASSDTELKVGQNVYFVTLKFGGSFSTIVNVPSEFVFPLPDHADPVQVAALTNPAMSSWMALRTRVNFSELPKGFSVLIMGATSESGHIAVEMSRHLGAGKVIGVGRDVQKLGSVGVDVAIQLKEKVEETDFSGIGHVDVILDYVYGPATIHLLTSLKTRAPVQYVEIGGLSSQFLELPAPLMRKMDLTIRGCGPGAWTFTALVKELPGMLEPVVKLTKREVCIFKLNEVQEKWAEKHGKSRIIYIP